MTLQLVKTIDSEYLDAVSQKGLLDVSKTKYLERNPVILILDKHLQCFPWESMEILQDQSGKRDCAIG